MKGMLCSIYRSDYDCTNGGVSSKVTKCILIGKGVPEIFEPSADAPALYLTDRAISGQCAKPSLDSNEWYMFGGNFVYSSDSRFPSQQPIAIHDRQETAQQSRIHD